MDKILISIKPKYINEILIGSKIMELRRRVGRLFTPNNEIYLYSSSPVKALVGKTTIKNVVRKELASLHQIKDEILKDACITKYSFDEYFKKSQFCYMIYFGEITLIKKTLDINFMRNIGVTPPQSFCYLQDKTCRIIESRGFEK